MLLPHFGISETRSFFNLHPVLLPTLFILYNVQRGWDEAPDLNPNSTTLLEQQPEARIRVLSHGVAYPPTHFEFTFAPNLREVTALRKAQGMPYPFLQGLFNGNGDSSCRPALARQLLSTPASYARPSPHISILKML